MTSRFPPRPAFRWTESDITREASSALRCLLPRVKSPASLIDFRHSHPRTVAPGYSWLVCCSLGKNSACWCSWCPIILSTCQELRRRDHCGRRDPAPCHYPLPTPLL